MSETPELLRTPPGYVTWSAADKHDWLWSALIEASAHTPPTLPPLRVPFRTRPLEELSVVVRKDRLDEVLTRDDDLLGAGRPKVIHARGSVAMIELDTDESSPFTGLLAGPPTGGAIGLIRLSLVARVGPRGSYTPAMGLKFLIDRHPSADVLAMNHTIGQGRDFDVFSNEMTNDLSDTHTQLRPPQRVMSVAFNRVSRRPRRLESSHLTERGRDGSPVAMPVSPDRLIFRPTDAARAVFVGRAGVDFRLVLADLPAGTPLYDVVGVVDGTDATVGTLRTTTPFRSSDGGDRLFFRHVQTDGDQKLRS